MSTIDTPFHPLVTPFPISSTASILGIGKGLNDLLSHIFDIYKAALSAISKTASDFTNQRRQRQLKQTNAIQKRKDFIKSLDPNIKNSLVNDCSKYYDFDRIKLTYEEWKELALSCGEGAQNLWTRWHSMQLDRKLHPYKSQFVKEFNSKYNQASIQASFIFRAKRAISEALI
jgi:hypothetical protein